MAHTNRNDDVDDFSRATHAKIEEIRKNIFSIYAKELEFKRRCARNYVSENAENENGDKVGISEEKSKQEISENSDTTVKVTESEVSQKDRDNHDKSCASVAKNQETQKPEVETESSASVDHGQSPVKINTTSFSVADILDPGKFTGVKFSSSRSWHPWLQRDDKEMMVADDSDGEGMIDDSGKYRFTVTNICHHV